MTLQEKQKAVQSLYQNKDFQELIIEDFITNGIHRLCMTENVDSEAIRDELKGRKLLNDFLYGIMNEAEIAEIENKE